MSEPQSSIPRGSTDLRRGCVADTGLRERRAADNALLLYASVTDLLAIVPAQCDERIERALRLVEFIEGGK